MHTGLSIGQLLIFLLPVIALELILKIVALVDLIRREPGRVNGNKIMWALLIILINLVGSIVYLIAGRKEQVDNDTL